MRPSELRADALGLHLGGREVLAGIGLTARPGEPLAISGASGSGKTVLLLTLAGLLAPTEGTVSIDGTPVVAGALPPGTHLGVILQTQGLLPELTAAENVALPLQEAGRATSEVASLTSEALAAVGLDTVGDRLSGELSGGQRQRVGVARALAGSPEIVIADEPTSELDPDNRTRILSLVLGSAPPRIVVIASNDPEVVKACRHVIRLRDGRIDPDG
ncbi:MAG TPA: ATP-binding cassette domain-containing protein [Acidimicrobiales bacterium]|nr:ATP-binding cassette domain-containing protein [Acidimicrobiales bacterium]